MIAWGGRRSLLLLLLGVSLIVVAWQWRSVVTTEPERSPLGGWVTPASTFAGVNHVTPDLFSPLRVLAGLDDQPYALEVLWSTGILGASAGPPSIPAVALSELWVVPPDACDLLVRSPQRPGASVILGPCASAWRELGLPDPVVWDAPGAITAVGAGPPLPLPDRGAEWLEIPSGWSPLLRRQGGGVIALLGPSASVVVTSFDVAAWVRHLRQGDPLLMGTDRDGINGPKPNDGLPFPWSEELWQLPGADRWAEQLVSFVAEAGADLGIASLPRLWLSPGGASSALILTFDQDFAEEGWIDPLLARVEQAGGEATLMTTSGTRQSNADPMAAQGGPELRKETVVRWQDWGHGVGLHPNAAGLSGSDVSAAIRLQAQRWQ